MPSTTAYRRADVVLVSFPFTDLSSAKRRPALVVSPDSLNDLAEDLVLVAITSQLSDDPSAIHLAEADFLGGNLPRASMVKIAKLFTIHSSLIIKRVSGLKPNKTAEILDMIRRFFS